MASYVHRASSVALKLVKTVETKVVPPAVDYYTAHMAKNTQFVVKDPVAAEKLGRQLVYTNLARCVALRVDVRFCRRRYRGRPAPVTALKMNHFFIFYFLIGADGHIFVVFQKCSSHLVPTHHSSSNRAPHRVSSSHRITSAIVVQHSRRGRTRADRVERGEAKMGHRGGVTHG